MRLNCCSVLFIASLCHAQECAPIEIDKVSSGHGAPSSSFGGALAISGDLAIFGAITDNSNGTNAGAAYIYRFDGTQWVEEAELLSDDGASFDFFGHSVAISGQTALIGAPNGGAGSAYIFQYDGIAWNQQAKLTASDAEVADQFGSAVAIADGVALVGAYRDDDSGENAGAAYVFLFDGKQWLQSTKLLSASSNPGDEMGTSIAFDGTTLMIGAPGNTTFNTDPGKVHVYSYDPLGQPSQWTDQATLQAIHFNSQNWFGASIALDNGRAIIGTPGENLNGSLSGAAYIFDFDGKGWIESATLLPDTATAVELFGSSVAIDGDHALVGVPARDSKDGFDTGAAYLYERIGANWIQSTKLSASDSSEFDSFGSSVGMNESQMIIGARGDHTFTGIGSAYVFDLNCAAGCIADLTGDGVLNFFDVSAFLQAFGANDLIADFSGDGLFNFFDVSAFLQAFTAGCP